MWFIKLGAENCQITLKWQAITNATCARDTSRIIMSQFTKE